MFDIYWYKIRLKMAIHTYLYILNKTPFYLLFDIFSYKKKIVAAFRGMHVSPAKHSYASVTDRRTDSQTDGRRTK